MLLAVFVHISIHATHLGAIVASAIVVTLAIYGISAVAKRHTCAIQNAERWQTIQFAYESDASENGKSKTLAAQLPKYTAPDGLRQSSRLPKCVLNDRTMKCSAQQSWRN